MNFLVLASAVSIFALVPPTTPPEPVIQMQPPAQGGVINPDASFGKTCPPTSRTEAARRGGPLQPQHLDELPAADMYKAVYRRVDGCNVPIIARFGIGAR